MDKVFCTSCNKYKNKDKFWESCITNINTGCCKKCKIYKQNKRNRSMFGLLIAIYNNQKSNGIAKGFGVPKYSFEEFVKWVMKPRIFEKYIMLWYKWMKSDYNKWLRPSVDRVDLFKEYCIDNIQLLTWKMNFTKGCKESFKKIGKPVLQFTKDMVLVDEFPSAHEASRKTNCNHVGISSRCRGTGKTSGGFIWRYKYE